MYLSKKRILIIVAHPDDESFGCGGLIKKLKKKNKIFVVSFTNGVSSRNKTSIKKIDNRKAASIKASKILGFKWLAQYNFPDNELDKIIKDLNAESIKDMGRVMGIASKTLSGKAENSRIAQKIKEKLN